MTNPFISDLISDVYPIIQKVETTSKHTAHDVYEVSYLRCIMNAWYVINYLNQRFTLDYELINYELDLNFHDAL